MGLGLTVATLVLVRPHTAGAEEPPTTTTTEATTTTTLPGPSAEDVERTQAIDMAVYLGVFGLGALTGRALWWA